MTVPEAFALLAAGTVAGAAGGVPLLAILAAMLAEPLIRVNAIKNAVRGTANGVAAIIFAIFAPVHWSFVPLLAAGFLAGGITAPRLIRTGQVIA